MFTEWVREDIFRVLNIFFVILLLASSVAQAYVGPGLGLGVLGAILGGILAVLLAIFGVFWYPIKRLLKKNKASKSESDDEKTNEQNSQAEEPAD